MTLIITAATPNRIIQVADRRVTHLSSGRVSMRPHKDEEGTYRDDDTNKTIYARCFDAHFVVSYTGLAEVAGEPVFLWLARTLSNVCENGIDSVFAHFDTHVLNVFRRHSSVPTTFILAGFRYVTIGEDPRVVPAVFVWSRSIDPHASENPL